MRPQRDRTMLQQGGNQWDKYLDLSPASPHLLPMSSVGPTPGKPGPRKPLVHPTGSTWQAQSRVETGGGWLGGRRSHQNSHGISCRKNREPRTLESQSSQSHLWGCLPCHQQEYSSISTRTLARPGTHLAQTLSPMGGDPDCAARVRNPKRVTTEPVTRVADLIT